MANVFTRVKKTLSKVFSWGYQWPVHCNEDKPEIHVFSLGCKTHLTKNSKKLANVFSGGGPKANVFSLWVGTTDRGISWEKLTANAFHWGEGETLSNTFSWGGGGTTHFLKKKLLVKSIFKKRIDDQFMFIRKIGNSESCRLVWEYSSWNDGMKTTKMRIFVQNEIDRRLMLTRIGTDLVKNDTYQFLLRLKV